MSLLSIKQGVAQLARNLGGGANTTLNIADGMRPELVQNQIEEKLLTMQVVS